MEVGPIVQNIWAEVMEMIKSTIAQGQRSLTCLVVSIN